MPLCVIFSVQLCFYHLSQGSACPVFCLFVCILLLKNFFLIIIFYFNNFILFYFTLFYFIVYLLLSFFLYFPPFYSQPCGGQAFGAPARHQGCATELEEPTSGHWSTRDLPAPSNIKWRKSPKDLHLNNKTQLHSTTRKLQCRMPHAKQLAKQEHSPIHQQRGCLKP